jgi:DNA replication protein DnaC
MAALINKKISVAVHFRFFDGENNGLNNAPRDYYKKALTYLFSKNIFKNSGTLFDTILYGPSGAGKMTLFMGYLQQLFGVSVLNLVPNSENKNIDLSFNLERVGVPLSNTNLVVINDSVNDETLYDL